MFIFNISNISEQIISLTEKISNSIDLEMITVEIVKFLLTVGISLLIFKLYRGHKNNKKNR